MSFNKKIKNKIHTPKTKKHSEQQELQKQLNSLKSSIIKDFQSALGRLEKIDISSNLDGLTVSERHANS